MLELRKLGYENAAALTGGWNEWVKRQLPKET